MVRRVVPAGVLHGRVRLRDHHRAPPLPVQGLDQLLHDEGLAHAGRAQNQQTLAGLHQPPGLLQANVPGLGCEGDGPGLGGGRGVVPLSGLGAADLKHPLAAPEGCWAALLSLAPLFVKQRLLV